MGFQAMGVDEITEGESLAKEHLGAPQFYVWLKGQAWPEQWGENQDRMGQAGL